MSHHKHRIFNFLFIFLSQSEAHKKSLSRLIEMCRVNLLFTIRATTLSIGNVYADLGSVSGFHLLLPASEKLICSFSSVCVNANILFIKFHFVNRKNIWFDLAVAKARPNSHELKCRVHSS